MVFRKPRLLIAGLRGGSGKTLVTLGLIAAWRAQQGLQVVPFKKGPDYIDAGWLAMAAQHPCYNLDPFLMAGVDIWNSFVKRSSAADVSIVEGNRGLYDGVDIEGSCSSAELAKLLRAPVILVLDATKVTRTAAALVLGCQQMDPEINIAGVILNQVAGRRHEKVLRGAIDRYCQCRSWV
jgi:cobyrinic acid a,c-diamide synthase